MTIMQWLALAVLALIYGGSGIAELFTWRKSVEQYVKWNYPSWWALVTPVIKIIAAVLLVCVCTRVLGILLCVAVALAAGATVLWHKERDMYKAALPVVALTLVSAGLLIL